MRYVHEVITPAKAQDLLERVPSFQRRVRKTAVARYAKDMLEGRWTINPSPVVLDSDGRLIDGQHRLRAVVVSGATVRMIVCYDADPVAFQTLDIGVTRDASDLSGGAMSKNAAAMIRNAMCLDGLSHGHATISKPAVVEAYIANAPTVDAILTAAPRNITVAGTQVPLWSGTTWAVMLRAVPFLGLDSVTKFAQSASDRDSHDQVARLVRDHLLTAPRRAGYSSQITTFRKVARTLLAWSEGEMIQKIYATTVDYWPLQFREDGQPDFSTDVSQ